MIKCDNHSYKPLLILLMFVIKKKIYTKEMFCKTVHFSETSDLQSSLAQVQNLTPRLQYPQCTAHSAAGSVPLWWSQILSARATELDMRSVLSRPGKFDSFTLQIYFVRWLNLWFSLLVGADSRFKATGLTPGLPGWPFKAVSNFLKSNNPSDDGPLTALRTCVYVISERHLNAPLDGTRRKTNRECPKEKT